MTTVRRTRITLLQRPPELSRATIDEHWARPHVPLIKALPGIVSYVQHHVVIAEPALELPDRIRNVLKEEHGGVVATRSVPFV